MAGLSLTSFVSELAAYTITVAYNLQFGYPFSTFGDTGEAATYRRLSAPPLHAAGCGSSISARSAPLCAAICWLQNVAIVGLIFRFNPTYGRPLKLGIALGVAAFSAWLFSGACGVRLLTALQATSVLILAFGGRLPQVLVWTAGPRAWPRRLLGQLG